MSTGPARPGDHGSTSGRGRFEDGPGHLVVDVDLDVDVTDLAGRHTSGRLVGSGHRLRLEVGDPAVVVSTAGRRDTHGLGTRLAAAGVRAELHGPHGRVARFEPGRTSRLGTLLAGSPHVILDRAGWAVSARAALPTGRSSVTRWAAAVAAATVLAGAVVGGVLVRRLAR